MEVTCIHPWTGRALGPSGSATEISILRVSPLVSHVTFQGPLILNNGICIHRNLNNNNHLHQIFPNPLLPQ